MPKNHSWIKIKAADGKPTTLEFTLYGLSGPE
jgi:hypothetical protein